MCEDAGLNMSDEDAKTSRHRAARLARPRPLAWLGQRINYLLWERPFRGAARISAVVSKALIGPVRGPTICPTRYGFRLVADPTSANTVDKAVFLKGTYEAGTIAVVAQCLRRGDIFIDVGSYIGLMALAASKLVGEDGVVHAFEPEPRSFDVLRKNVEMNRAPNVLLHNVALGSAPGKARISSSPTSRASAALMRRPELGGGEEVTVETLDRVLSRSTPPTKRSRLRIMKVDVEGWELEVLRGARELLGSPYAPILCVECSTHRADQMARPLDLYNFIVCVNNYVVYRLEKSKERPSRLVVISTADELQKHDNLFCFRPEHVRTLPGNMFRH